MSSLSINSKKILPGVGSPGEDDVAGGGIAAYVDFRPRKTKVRRQADGLTPANSEKSRGVGHGPHRSSITRYRLPSIPTSRFAAALHCLILGFATEYKTSVRKFTAT